MRIEYQLTVADYAEVSRGHARFRPWVFMWLIGLLACCTLISDLAPPQGPAAALPAPSLLRDVVYPFLPWMAILVAIWVIVFRALRVNWRKPWLRRPQPRGDSRWVVVAMFAALFAAIPVLFVMAIRAQRAATTHPRESPVLNVVLPLIPWIILAGFLGFVFRRFRGVFQRGWETQPHMHRPFVAEIDQACIRLSEPLSRHEYRWEYFPGWVETASLFVIYVSPLSFHSIPKRAFSDDAQRAEFADLLRQKIHAPTNAFPVLPSDIRPLPPIPN